MRGEADRNSVKQKNQGRSLLSVQKTATSVYILTVGNEYDEGDLQVKGRPTKQN